MQGRLIAGWYRLLDPLGQRGALRLATTLLAASHASACGGAVVSDDASTGGSWSAGGTPTDGAAGAPGTAGGTLMGGAVSNSGGTPSAGETTGGATSTGGGSNTGGTAGGAALSNTGGAPGGTTSTAGASNTGGITGGTAPAGGTGGEGGVSIPRGGAGGDAQRPGVTCEDNDCADGATCLEGICITTGLLQFTLTWEDDADLDLYIIEPDDDVIYFGTYSSTNPHTAETPLGHLDANDCNWRPDVAGGTPRLHCLTAGTHVENIYFDAPPEGEYVVIVAGYWTGGTSISSTVTIAVHGVAQLSDTGSVDDDSIAGTNVWFFPYTYGL